MVLESIQQKMTPIVKMRQNQRLLITSLNEKLSAKVSAPEMYDIKLMEDKDNRIKELEAEVEELVKQGSRLVTAPPTIFLPSRFALQIYQTTSINRYAGIPSEFNLKHDGNKVIKVNESKRSEVAS